MAVEFNQLNKEQQDILIREGYAKFRGGKYEVGDAKTNYEDVESFLISRGYGGTRVSSLNPALSEAIQITFKRSPEDRLTSRELEYYKDKIKRSEQDPEARRERYIKSRAERGLPSTQEEITTLNLKTNERNIKINKAVATGLISREEAEKVYLREERGERQQDIGEIRRFKYTPFQIKQARELSIFEERAEANRERDFTPIAIRQGQDFKPQPYKDFTPKEFKSETRIFKDFTPAIEIRLDKRINLSETIIKDNTYIKQNQRNVYQEFKESEDFLNPTIAKLEKLEFSKDRYAPIVLDTRTLTTSVGVSTLTGAGLKFTLGAVKTIKEAKENPLETAGVIGLSLVPYGGYILGGLAIGNIATSENKLGTTLETAGGIAVFAGTTKIIKTTPAVTRFTTKQLGRFNAQMTQGGLATPFIDAVNFYKNINVEIAPTKKVKVTEIIGKETPIKVTPQATIQFRTLRIENKPIYEGTFTKYDYRLSPAGRTAKEIFGVDINKVSKREIKLEQLKTQQIDLYKQQRQQAFKLEKQPRPLYNPAQATAKEIFGVDINKVSKREIKLEQLKTQQIDLYKQQRQQAFKLEKQLPKRLSFNLDKIYKKPKYIQERGIQKQSQVLLQKPKQRLKVINLDKLFKKSQRQTINKAFQKQRTKLYLGTETRTSQISLLLQKPKLRYKTKTKQALGLRQRQRPLTTFKTAQRQINIQLSRQRQIPRQISIQIQRQPQISIPIQRQIPRQRQTPIQEAKQRQIPRQISIQSLSQSIEQIPRQISSTTTAQATSPRSITIPRLITPQQTRLKPFTLFSEPKQPKTKKTKTEAYNAYVKQGKQTIKANEKPLGKNQAKNLLMEALDGTTARSGYIRRTKGNIDNDESLNTFLLTKFRSPTGRSRLPKNSFVEKSEFAIDSFGELQGIPFKAMRLRKQKLIY